MPNLVLVGPAAVGKSSIGRYLAKTLKYQLIDTDTEIEKRCGVPVSWIFELEGEDGFRRHEQRLLQSLGHEQRQGLVLATGGGMVITRENRDMLQDIGVVAYLSAGLDHLMKRTKRGNSRPLLQGAGRSAALQQMLTEREPLYSSIANITLNTGEHKNARHAALALADKLLAAYPEFAEATP